MILLYLDGKEIARHRYREYFLPEGNMTASALKTHRLTMEDLKKKGAKPLSRSALERLGNFLRERKDLPIIAHNVKYDIDQVLKPALKKLSLNESWLQENRWECTIKLADSRTDLVPREIDKDLNSLLKHFNLEYRDPKANHDAYIDCQKTAQLYMKLKEASLRRARHITRS